MFFNWLRVFIEVRYNSPFLLIRFFSCRVLKQNIEVKLLQINEGVKLLLCKSFVKDNQENVYEHVKPMPYKDGKSLRVEKSV